MRRPTVLDRLRYRFDSLMSRGTSVLVACLWLASIVLILTTTLIVVGSDMAPRHPSGRPLTPAEVAWMCLMRTLDGGTMGQDSGSWGFLLAMLFVTTGGLLITATLIGILTAGIDLRLQEMRKGRSFVVEREHVVILGWTEQIFLILRELLHANEKTRSFRVAVLATRDKVEMEDSLRKRLPRSHTSRIVCRTGDPTDAKDLEIVNPAAARAVIVLSADGESKDAQTLQAVMALATVPDSARPSVVTEVTRASSLELLSLARHADVQAVVSSDLVARLTAQACRQPGLAAVYHDLLDFEGNEILVCDAGDGSGSSFGDALLAYADAIPIGIRRAAGGIQLNPAPTTRIADGDQLIAIAAGHSAVRFTGLQRMLSDASVISSRWSLAPRERRPEGILLLGWNSWSAKFLEQLDAFVPPGSRARVVSRGTEATDQLSGRLSKLTVDAVARDVAARAVLDALDVPGFDHVVVVADTDRLDPDAADARSLAVLLYLREIASRCPQRFSITCEILVEKNRDALLAAGVDDLISSAQVASLLMSQIIQNRDVARVFEALFDPTGPEFYLKAAESYVTLGTPLDFVSAILAAREHGEIAVGFRRAGRAGELVLNPSKTHRMTFSPGDRLVVLAED